MSVFIARTVRCALGVCLLFLANVVQADELPIEILNKVRSATVFIKVLSVDLESRGSGFFVTPEIVVTNAHVIGITRENKTLPLKVEVVLNSGTPQESILVASVDSFDVPNDLAFLRVPRQANASVLSLRPSADIRETLSVYILGFPLGELLDRNGHNPSITIGSGNVSSLRRDADNHIAKIQIDGSLIPGNSGGPIIDSTGKLVAVSVSTILGTGIGFSIPGDSVQANLDGRIDGIGFAFKTHADDMYSIKAVARTIDPLKRVQRLTLYYWTSRLNAQRPPDPQGKFGTHGAPGDGPKEQVDLTFNARENTWIGEIPKFALAADQDFWIQPAAVKAEEIRRVAASSLGKDLRQEKNKPSQSGSVASVNPLPQRSFSPAPGLPRAGSGRPAPSPSGGMGSGARNHAPGKSGIVSASREGDESGNPYTLVTTVASTASLGDTKLIQMVADPRQARLYVILQNQPKVFVFDPTDMSLKDEIPVPREPVSIWCDAERLIVACSQSRVVVFIDTETLKPVKSVRVAEAEAGQPQRIVGRTPSGSAIALWAMPGSANRNVSVYLMSEKGESQKLYSGDLEWCSLPEENVLWIQNNFGGSPSGVARPVSTSDPKAGDRFQAGPFSGKGLSMHRCFGHCFLSEDRQSFLVPTEARGLVSGEAWAYATRTLVARPDLSKIVMEMDGSVLCEYPAGNCYVAWKDGRTPAYITAGPEILYYSRSTGRMVRRIFVENFKPHPVIFTHQQAIPEAVFVPGQELLLVRDHKAETAVVTVIRCGPVNSEVNVTADPAMRSENAPPKLAVVGKPMSFTPKFARPDKAKSIVFRLAQTVSGMEIDASTGKVSFTPTDADLGLYDIAIVADVDGVEVPVISWALEIDLP